MISAKDLSKKFKGVLLNFPNLEIQAGELTGLLGPSGSGKTTLLRMIAGLEEPQAGEIYLNHQLVNNPKILVPPQKRGVALVFQELALWPHLTAFAHLEFVLGAKAEARSTKHEARNKIERLFRLVKFPENLSQRYPHQLSGGEKQRLAIARALAQNPKILLLDEPFNNLDEELREELKKELKRVHQEMNLTTIYVTHHKEELAGLADRIVRLK